LPIRILGDGVWHTFSGAGIGESIHQVVISPLPLEVNDVEEEDNQAEGEEEEE
jgi:hypothetical protein